jgi:hypothetical protein
VVKQQYLVRSGQLFRRPRVFAGGDDNASLCALMGDGCDDLLNRTVADWL